MLIALIYLVCFGLRAAEYLVLRTDQSVVGEAFVHKLAGGGVLVLCARRLGYGLAGVGFARGAALRHTLYGLLLGLGVFAAAYGTEFALLRAQGARPQLAFYASGYSISGDVVLQTGAWGVLVCLAGNAVNVFMEEGMFRGLLVRLGEERWSWARSMLLAAACFGLWHVAQSVRGYLDGEMSLRSAVASGLVYVVMTFVMGLKFGMLQKVTGSLWMPMADHFVNNTIVNLLHVVSVSGADEWQAVRISVAQTLSFVMVLALFVGTRAWRRPTFR